MHRKPRALFLRALFVGSAILSALLSASCSKSSGSGTSTASGFQLLTISVFPNDTWKINRAIEFEFSEPIDFLSVSSNTINIATLKGLPATGTFSFKRIDTDADGILDSVDETIIVFQPTCPLLANFSDAGLQPSSTYLISVVGRSSGTDNTLKSKAGNKSLDITQRRQFFTPNSVDRSVVFLDGAFGPPEPVVRTMGSTVAEGVTYLEIGSNTSPDSRIFFEFDPVSQTYNTASGMAAPSVSPLNLYAEPTSRVAMVVEFNQPVDPSALNISPTRVYLEFMDSGGMWLPLDTSVQLVENCTTSGGARVRLEAVGVLPAGSFLRAVIKPGFLDITGADATQATRTAFAVVPTAPIAFASLPANPTDGADEYIEEFDFETGPLAFQDKNALFATAMASWKDGQLKAAFDFEGTGGPSGDFDWLIETGEVFLFDTDGTSIIGGPNGAKNAVENTIGGVVDIRNLTIEAGGELRVQGSKPLQINASGTVQIDGQITLNGRDAKDVVLVNSANLAAAGGAGAAGGGAGGSGSGALNTSTPRGSRGRGPLGSGPLGGFGGESAYAPVTMGKDARRPGGGGGGRFAPDIDTMVDGLYAGAGLDGNALSHSAVTGAIPALGGQPGVGPFVDLDPNNNYFGVKPEVVENGPGDFSVTDLVRGELPGLRAGYGGGGGGDALPASEFPTPDWTPEIDERGGGGGGGGGGLRLRALGPVIFGPAGEIHADGGRGATGENTLEQDHVAGTGGAGSGGHVMIESATRVDFTNGDPAMAPFPSAPHITAFGGPQRTGPLTNPVIPTDISYGGSGGPGVVQIHVPRVNTYDDDELLSDIVLPSVVIAGATANKLEDVSTPAATHLVATFGAQSAARSRWISIGGADQDPVNGVERLSYLFGGIETAGMDAGKILTTAGVVDALPAVLGPELLSAGSVAIIGDGVTLQVAGVSLVPIIDTPSDIYLRTPALLKNFVLRIEESATPTTFKDFVVAAASYNDAGQRLSLMSGAALDNSADTISSYAGTLAAPAYRLLPRFFQVSTDGVINSLPDSSFVKISFEGTKDDGFGAPDEANILVPMTSDIDDFNSLALPLGDLKYFRIQVEFDLDAMAAGLTPDTKPVALDFLRLPFRF